MTCGQRFRNALFAPSHTVVKLVPLGNVFMALREMCLPWAGSWKRAQCGHVRQWAVSCLQPVSLVGTCLSHKQLRLSRDGHQGSASKLLKHRQILGLGNGSQDARADLHNKVYPGTGGGRTEKVNQQLQGIRVAVCTFPRPFQSLFATRHQCDFEI